MKNIIILTVLTLTMASTALAQTDGNDFWSDDHKSWQPTAEMVERTLDRLAQNDPQKAQQLRQMQQENPQAFEKEIRQLIKDRVQNRLHQGPQPRPEHNKKGPGKEPGRFRRRMQQEKDLFEQWLQTHYPDQALTLEKLQDTNPELYRRELMETIHQYGHLYRAEKENPQLAQVLKKDMRLKQAESDLVDEINDSQNEQEKQELTAELEKVLSQRFDIIIQRKQLQTQQMQQRLEKLQQELNKKKSDIENLETRKEKEIKLRLKEILSPDQQLQWN